MSFGQVVFDEGSEETLLETARETELTGFFDYNARFPDTDVRYVDFPKKKLFGIRKTKNGTSEKVLLTQLAEFIP